MKSRRCIQTGLIFTLFMMMAAGGVLTWQDHAAADTAGSPESPAVSAAVRGSTQIKPLERPPVRDRVRRSDRSGFYAGRYFFIERPLLGLGLSYEYEHETRTGPDSETEDTLHEFWQWLNIESAGWIYHPALFSYSFGFQPQMKQQIEIHDPGDRGSSKYYLEAYNLDATLLQLKPYTLHMFGRRHQDPVGNVFTGTTEAETDTYGADLSLKYQVLPTTLSYSHIDASQRGYYSSDEDRDDYRLFMRHNRKKSTTQLNANYSDNVRTSDGVTTRTKSTNNELRNDYNITDDRRIVLNSNLTYRWTDSNAFESSNLRLFERLNWQHRPKLRSNYRFIYDSQDTDTFDRETTTLGAGLTHQLYENLTTRIDANAFFSDFTGGQEDSYDGSIDFSYRRPVPWGAINLDAGFGADYTTRQYDTEDEYIAIINEPHVLRDADITLLNNENVDQDSVVVTDSTGSITYVENTDYTLEAMGSFTRIIRTTFGAIANGQLVLVDYRYFSQPAYDDIVYGQKYGLSFQFRDAMRLAYNFYRADQDILSGTPPDNPVDDTIHRAEARLWWRWTDTRLLFEDSDRRSSISTSSWRAEEQLIFRPDPRLFLSLTGHFGFTRIKENDETNETYGLSAEADWQPKPWWRLHLESYGTRISGDSEKTLDVGLYAVSEANYRIWTSRVSYRFVNQEDDITDQGRRTHKFIFELIRRLW